MSNFETNGGELRNARRQRTYRPGMANMESARTTSRSGTVATFNIQCARCGAAATVPFKPRQGRAVYCRQCYAANSQRQPRPTNRPQLATDIGFSLGRGRGGYREGLTLPWQRSEQPGNQTRSGARRPHRFGAETRTQRGGHRSGRGATPEKR